ncbi:macrolide family glycosyltransferase [Amycolatopsis australiensis]|uniref:Glycosyltransferase, MGT family n=1 Tax=Amycolatopsis australiensis TaxID=546364 RepID=A0A1K1SWD6_9PSEU|nr:macrolide family glycosyltransferase [Amycolatopsis australiensis]SFW88548.1 glycosyltransferase, MGT family [Amycolatopsis australiensis]
MSSDHIAVFSFAATGHVTPLLGIVEELVRRGHRVSWVSTAEFAERIEATGAAVVRYEGGRSVSDVGLDDITGDNAVALSEGQFAESVAAAEAAEACFAADPPDLVLYDTTVLAPARLLSVKLGVPAVQLFPSFAVNKRFSLLERMPEVAKMWAESGIAETLGARLAGFLTDHGVDMPVGEFYSRAEPLNLAVLPKVFQYASDRFEDGEVVFVGPCLGSRAEADGWTPPASGLPVVLISLGSLRYHQGGSFLRDCVDAFAGLPWHVVLSTGHQVRPEELGELPANIEAHPWLPQTAVLRHAAVFVTHTGMGSTMEALYFGVPLVAVPRMPEQNAVADRIVEVGAGVKIAHDEISATRLAEAVTRLGTDQDTRSRLAVLSKLTRDAGGAARAADEIERVLTA